jgi:hypothetical protein
MSMKPYKWAGTAISGGLAQSAIDCLEKFNKSGWQVDPDLIYSLGGYRPSAGRHSSGIAIDVNYGTNGYFICSTGGELGAPRLVHDKCAAALKRVRSETSAVCDISPRSVGETYGDCWDRWHETSDAIVSYLSPLTAFYLPDKITRAQADQYFSASLGGAIVDEKQRIADFHALRIPLVIGAPVDNPMFTRNPARGIMDLPKELVVGLMASGFKRWGAVDFGAASGDIMHFDLG